MPDVLDFNPDRDLLFDPERDLGFDSERRRGFDPERDLGFDANRDLPFGKRGVVFRGYVCPVCGASVTADAPSCTECGAIFEVKKGAPPPKPKAPPAPTQTHLPPPPPPPDYQRPAPPPPPVRMYPPPPKRVETRNCVYCGARVSGSDAFCWNCGNRMHGGR